MVSSSIWPPFASSDFFSGEASREATRGHGTLVCVATLVGGLLECGVKKVRSNNCDFIYLRETSSSNTCSVIP